MIETLLLIYGTGYCLCWFVVFNALRKQNPLDKAMIGAYLISGIWMFLLAAYIHEKVIE